MKTSSEKSAARRQVVVRLFRTAGAKFARLKLTFGLCHAREEYLSKKFYLQPIYKVGVAMRKKS
jgi:hypothetical protein